MEDYKDVMLSEPPARYQPAAQVTQPNATSMASLENYKGILLCDRPVDAYRRGQPNEKGGPLPFLPAGQSSDDRYLGLQPTIEQRARGELSRTNVSASKKGGPGKAALSKHRRWLNSFAQEVKRMKEGQTEELISQDITLQRIRKREEEKRKKRLTGGMAPASADAEHSEQQPAAENESTAPMVDYVPTKPSGPSSSAKSGKKDKSKKKKPKWAMTEEEAMDDEFAEARQLVDFAAQLDYDKFINDYEVREAMAVMRDRVQEIADEQGIDLTAAQRDAENQDDDDAVSVAESQMTTVSVVSSTTGERRKMRVPRRPRTTAGPDGADVGAGWNNSTKTDLRAAINSDSLALAEKILMQSEAMRKVHSKQSLARLLQDVALNPNKLISLPPIGGMNNANTNMQTAIANERMQSQIADPVITTVSATATGDGGVGNQPTKRVLVDLKKSKEHVQNLPYLYRCPSI